MQRPSYAELVRVAAGRFLSLEQLRSIGFVESGLPAEISPRERAIVAVLSGDLLEAERILAAGDEALTSSTARTWRH
jgi:hypothetical protein